MLVACLAYSSALNMEAVHFSEMSLRYLQCPTDAEMTHDSKWIRLEQWKIFFDTVGWQEKINAPSFFSSIFITCLTKWNIYGNINMMRRPSITWFVT
jgi:hypothetical protein